MFRHLAVIGSAVGVLGIYPGSAIGVVQDPVPIGLDQSFLGLVNGASSNVGIDMACFGAIRPGQTGHPLSGQSTEVQTTTRTSSGFTGDADRIKATLIFGTAGSLHRVVLARFSNYFISAPISTSDVFPCSGNGTVVFKPLDGGPQARPWNVTVAFAGQP